MALQTNVLRDGQWVTETVNLQAVLRANNASTSSQRCRAPSEPDCGILTRTVVESPIAHWILPVRLRSARQMDVAFIGDHYVQISELGRDGHLREVIRKTDFGSRIRNAKVIGSPPENTRDDYENSDASVKAGQDVYLGETHGVVADPSMAQPTVIDASYRPIRLPPQQLMVILESGDCVFLFARPVPENKHEFVTVRHQLPGNRIVQPGFHTAVDPSSRYMALACPEDFFVVYELESPEKLNRCYARGENLQPIKCFHPRSVNGIIHKMEFLYPRPEDDYHVILLLIIIRNGKARMVTYTWEAGENLGDTFHLEKRGQQLPQHHQMPILIIPLTVHSAFFAISADRIAVCKDALGIPAEFDDFVMDLHETSRFHHGSGQPLWAAWTRPYRLPAYRTTRDNIYLAREDGVVLFLEIDSDNILNASVEIGKFDCNIGTSFCSLFDDFNDILIMGGDSGPGTICQIRPRQPNIPLGTIPNWSPVVDIATTDPFSSLTETDYHHMKPWCQRIRSFSAPHQIYATSGRGVTGAITEFRNGYRANITLDIDFQMPVTQSWILPDSASRPENGFFLFVSMIDYTMVFHLSADLSTPTELTSEETAYDLKSRTIVALQLSEDTKVQITEKYLVFNSSNQFSRHAHSDTFQTDEINVLDASIHNDLIALSTHIGNSFRIHLLRLNIGGTIEIVKSFDESCDVSCLHLAMVAGIPYVMAGLIDNGTPYLVIYNGFNPEDTAPSWYSQINSDEIIEARKNWRRPGAACGDFEPLTSVAFMQREGDNLLTIVFGTRGGDVVTLSQGASGNIVKASSVQMGFAAAYVAIVDDPSLGMSVVVGCDGRLSMLSNYETRLAEFRSNHRIWLADAAEPSRPSPAVGAKFGFANQLPRHPSTTQLVLTTKCRVLLAELGSVLGPVPRSIPISATPLRIIYSTMLDCLIVAVKTLDDKTSIRFFDPNSGCDISQPTDKNGNPVPYVAGLGKTGDQILCINEWRYERGDDKWLFLLVSTKNGRLLVLSVIAGEIKPNGQREAIRFWTRSKAPTADEPIVSVIGWRNNMVYCKGSTIHWDMLDLVDKKLRTLATFELNSPATSLRIVKDNLLVLTDTDSLEVIHMEVTGAGDLALHHADSESRNATHMIEMGDGPPGVGTSLQLVSNRSCGISGLWVPWQQPGRDCKTVFEAELPASVRKLVRGRTRPSWLQAQRDVRYGLIPSTVDGAEILGACIDGSLQHFTLLSIPIWRVLRLVQNLALTTPTLYPFAFEPATDYKVAELEVDKSYNMQIDGDMLRRCIDKRALEELFVKPMHMVTLINLLKEVDGGRWTAPIANQLPGTSTELAWLDHKADYIAVLYDILEYFLAPVL